MKTVIYNMRTQEIIRVVDCVPNLSELNDVEDFMPVKLWNEGCESSGDFDKIIN